MDKTQIALQAHQMKDRNDLLLLLNRIKQDQLTKMGYAKMYKPFTEQQLNYYCNPNHTKDRYRHFKIRKKSNGWRDITSPNRKSYMSILKCLNEILKAIYEPSNYAMGFIGGRSVIDNAKLHKGMNYVFNIDLKDFFPSIEQPRIWKRLQLKPFKFPISVANAIAGLCCMKIETTTGPNYVLPQGAPTSPILTNMICDRLDHRLAGVAKRFGLNYSRYADDITFSSMHYVYHKNGDFRKEIHRIITDQNFTINDKKTRLQSRHERQEVTGITVNEKLNVQHKYVRNIRNILYIWNRYGYDTAFKCFLKKYKTEKGHIIKGIPDMAHVIEGKLMYLRMVKGEDDPVYIHLYTYFTTLCQRLLDNATTTKDGISYIETFALCNFEKKHDIKVSIVQSDNHKKKHTYAWFSFNDKKIIASVNKNLTGKEEKKDLAISICRDQNGKEFWLIHHINKIIKPSVQEINIDELNKDLDSLLNI